MKKLFLFFVLITATAGISAQNISKEERDAAILTACKYAFEHHMSAVEFGEYGSLLYLEIDDPSKYCNSIEWNEKYQKKYSLSAGDFIALVKKYREHNGGFIIPKGENTRYAVTHNYSAAKLKLKPVNTVVGASLIGASAASYAISASFISTSKNIKDYRKSMRIAGITCGAGCIIGAIVILSGLHKEYDGSIQVADNVVVSDLGTGLGVGVRF